MIQSAKPDNSLKTKTRSQYTSEWNEIQLNELYEGDIINMNEKEER